MDFEEPVVSKHIKSYEGNTSEVSTTSNSFNPVLKKHKKMLEK